MGTISLDARARNLIRKTLNMWESGKIKWTSGTWGRAVAEDGYEYLFEDRENFDPQWYEYIEEEKEVYDEDSIYPDYDYYKPFKKTDAIGEACAIGSLIVANGMNDDEVVRRAVIMLSEEITESPKWNDVISAEMSWSREPDDIVITLNDNKTTTFRRIKDLFSRASQ